MKHFIWIYNVWFWVNYMIGYISVYIYIACGWSFGSMDCCCNSKIERSNFLWLCLIWTDGIVWFCLIGFFFPFFLWLFYWMLLVGVDFKIKLLTVGGKKLKLTIWDTGNLFAFRFWSICCYLLAAESQTIPMWIENYTSFCLICLSSVALQIHFWTCIATTNLEDFKCWTEKDVS